jgi:hypothetical protein
MAGTWEWVSAEPSANITVTVGTFGRVTVRVNGQEVQRVRSGMSMKSVGVPLPSSHTAELSYGSPFGVGFRCELRLAGKLMLPRSAPKGHPRALEACPRCATALRGQDRFCDSCGNPLPSAEELTGKTEVQRGNSVIGALSILFVASGVLMYAGQRMVANEALRKIAAFDADAPLANPIPGVAAKTFGELRTQIEWEANSVLLVNLVLAAVMFGLWRWGKQKPTAAIIIAFCTYVVVIVTNAALDPRTIAQGWVLKFIVLVYLLRGLKAALALRASQASAA